MTEIKPHTVYVSNLELMRRNYETYCLRFETEDEMKPQDEFERAQDMCGFRWFGPEELREGQR